MILVKTELKPSTVHGLGLFAAEFIPKGTVIWEFREGVDHRIPKELVDALPDPARSTVRHYSALWGGGYVVSADDARYFNHSDTPNLVTLASPDVDIATRDIHPGEELFEDYYEFDEDAAEKLGAL